MRIVEAKRITEEVRRMTMETATDLPHDVMEKLTSMRRDEDSPLAGEILDEIIRNAEVAKETKAPMCQDTGMAVLFVTVGQEVHVEGNLTDAINEGVRQGYKDGYLRKSVVKDPVLDRVNTGDNTPAVIHYDIVPGDKIGILFGAKGFGSENMSRTEMMKPADGIEAIKRFVVETVRMAGPNPCPPVVVGVGIGGTLDKATEIAKKALFRELDDRNPNPAYAALEDELIEKINATGVGPQGFGGRTTGLAVKIATYPTHIAGMPVAVNINCHATRHAYVEI